VAEELVSLLLRGDPLHRFYFKTLQDMSKELGLEEEFVDEDGVQAQTVYEKFRARTLEHQDICELELKYPGSLVHFVRKTYAPMVNSHLQEKADEERIACAMLLFKKQHPGKILDFETPCPATRENLCFLYRHNKLPVTKQARERIELLESRFLAEEEVLNAVSFLPSSLTPATVYFNETDHPVFSPLAPQTRLGYKDYQFRHVWEYIYFWLLSDVLEDRKEALVVVQGISDWTDGTPDAVLEDIKARAVEKRLAGLVRKTVMDTRWNRWMLLTTGDKTDLVCEEPYDPCVKKTMQETLTRFRQALAGSHETRLLLKWARKPTVTTREFAVFSSLATNKRLWRRLFPGRDTEFFNVFYPFAGHSEKKAFRKPKTQDPREVVRRLREHGFLTGAVDKKTIKRMVAAACFPAEFFSSPRSIEI